jgi:hypothetical protein
MGVVEEVIEPAWPWPNPTMPPLSGVGMPSSRPPGLLAHICEPGDGPRAPFPITPEVNG